MIEERINEIFDEFQNFPNKNSLIRKGQRNDAFELLVLETLLYPYHSIRKLSINEEKHRDLVENSIVPPPDEGIDIFFEEENFDESIFHIIQVKKSELPPNDIDICFTMMEKKVSSYLKKPNSVHKNLRNIISNSAFTKENKNCIYYVVHSGNTREIRNQKKNQLIITIDELKLLKNGLKIESVPQESITIDTINNFIVNNFIEKSSLKKSSMDKTKPKSLLCNFNGYDLAKLNNKYSNTTLGRNILYGQNLRESLLKKSKTFSSMIDTINKEPELFLFYNNGITILAADVDAKSFKNEEKITLQNFSIINGAQTTSTLGYYLKEAEMNQDMEKIKQLKKVHVLTKIYEINSELKEHERISTNIKIYTNSQTPLSNRDMVSIRPEQIKIQRRFIEDFNNPNIFIYIKKGESIPTYPKFLPHQQITNERLAQLCFAGPMLDPFTAKDKRSKLFEYSPQDDCILNPLYNKIFNPEEGFLAKATNIKVDEVLFIYKLHEDSKRFQNKHLKSEIQKLSQTKSDSDIDKDTRPERINVMKRLVEIGGVFIFHNIAGYYIFKQSYDNLIENNENLIFDSRRYYNNKEFKNQMIQDFIDLVYNKSLDIIIDNSGIGNVQNWTRSNEGAKIFKKEFGQILDMKSYKYSKEYVDFIKKYKVKASL